MLQRNSQVLGNKSPPCISDFDNNDYIESINNKGNDLDMQMKKSVTFSEADNSPIKDLKMPRTSTKL